jgi:hypothetical protein
VLALRLSDNLAWLGLLFGFSWQIGSALAAYRGCWPIFQRVFEASCILAAILLDCWFILAPAFASLAHNLQYVRGQFQDGSSTLIKRAYRVIGFVVGGLFYVPGVSLLGWAICGILLTVFRGFKLFDEVQRRERRSWTLMSTVMVFHQIHYFLYAYGIAWILSEKDGVPLAAMGLAFAAGWIVYLAVEPVMGKVNDAVALIVGHAFVAAVLLVMSSDLAIGYASVLWVATGLGGGTVYCIHNLGCANAEMHLAEEIGHWVGPLLAIVAFVLGFDWDTVLRVAALFALLVVGLTLLSLGRSQPG